MRTTSNEAAIRAKRLIPEARRNRRPRHRGRHGLKTLKIEKASERYRTSNPYMRGIPTDTRLKTSSGIRRRTGDREYRPELEILLVGQVRAEERHVQVIGLQIDADARVQETPTTTGRFTNGLRLISRIGGVETILVRVLRVPSNHRNSPVRRSWRRCCLCTSVRTAR